MRVRWLGAKHGSVTAREMNVSGSVTATINLRALEDRGRVGGGGGNRTLVRIRDEKSDYMLIP